MIRRVLACVTALAWTFAALTPADASTRWSDTWLQEIDSSWVNAAAYDPGSARILTIGPSGIAAYRPGRSAAVWSNNYLPDLDPAGGYPYAGELLVDSARHRVYVGGGTLWGNSDAATSHGFVSAFDTRTGQKLWTWAEPIREGMMRQVSVLVLAPHGHLLAMSRKLIDSPQNSSGSYAMTITSIGVNGGTLWRWTDSRNSAAYDGVVTATGRFVFVGETANSQGWARGYVVAVDAEHGATKWRNVSQESYSVLWGKVVASPSGRKVYAAGAGSTGTIAAYSTSTGARLWTRSVPGGSAAAPYYSGVNAMASTEDGPCITGRRWQKNPDYSDVYPDGGYIACYGSAGHRRWLDTGTKAAGTVLTADGSRLLWSGRQVTASHDYADETVRFQIRSIDDGHVRHASSMSRTGRWSIPGSTPLLATPVGDAVHFVVSVAGSPSEDFTLLDRAFR